MLASMAYAYGESIEKLVGSPGVIEAMAPELQQATVSLLQKGGAGYGSGVVVSSDGFILTAEHVVEPMKDGVIVIFADGSRRMASILGMDKRRDAAILKVQGGGDYAFAKVGRSELMGRFDWVIGMGNTGGYDPARKAPVRLGRLLAKRGDLRTDAAMGMGDSGGPLFNLAGEVVGIHLRRGLGLDRNIHLPVEYFLRNWVRLSGGGDGLEALRGALGKGGEIPSFAGANMSLIQREKASLARVLNPLIERVRSGEVEVLSLEGKRLASGVVLTHGGKVLTSGSAIAGSKAKVRVGNEVREAKVIKRFPRYDLAVLSFDAKGCAIKPVDFYSKRLPLGRLVTSLGGDGVLRGLGVVGVESRSLEKVGYFGSRTRTAKEAILLSLVGKEGPAARAGLQTGDHVVSIDGKKADHLLIFLGVLRGKSKEEKVGLSVIRDGEKMRFSVVLDERVRKDPFLRVPDMKPYLGVVSKKTSGFAMVFQHDVPILPEECGGGVYDMEGRCVGVNLSRASRSRTYAIPSVVLIKLLEERKERKEKGGR